MEFKKFSYMERSNDKSRGGERGISEAISTTLGFNDDGNTWGLGRWDASGPLGSAISKTEQQ